jgi:hypothetical protein
MCESQGVTNGCKACLAAIECVANQVDWRAQCLGLKKTLSALGRTSAGHESRAAKLENELAALRATAAPVGLDKELIRDIRWSAKQDVLDWAPDSVHHQRAAATLRLLDAHAALVSHGAVVDEKLRVLVSNWRESASAILAADLEGAVDMAGVITDCANELEEARAPVHPPGDTPDGGA